jgi:transcriptional regulator with XRE-family HTH domain
MKNQFDGLRFSITVKIWRNMNGLTIRDMAELSGMAASSYGFVETGDRTPTMAEFSHLCVVMSMDAKDFFMEVKK